MTPSFIGIYLPVGFFLLLAAACLIYLLSHR